MQRVSTHRLLTSIISGGKGLTDPLAPNETSVTFNQSSTSGRMSHLVGISDLAGFHFIIHNLKFETTATTIHGPIRC